MTELSKENEGRRTAIDEPGFWNDERRVLIEHAIKVNAVFLLGALVAVSLIVYFKEWFIL